MATVTLAKRLLQGQTSLNVNAAAKKTIFSLGAEQRNWAGKTPRVADRPVDTSGLSKRP